MCRPYLKWNGLNGRFAILYVGRSKRMAAFDVRYWVYIPEAGKYLRVVTEPDGETVHNAFLDRGFKP